MRAPLVVVARFVAVAADTLTRDSRRSDGRFRTEDADRAVDPEVARRTRLGAVGRPAGRAVDCRFLVEAGLEATFDLA